MSKQNETDSWAVESESEPKQLWMIAAGAKAQNLHSEPKAEPEVWVPITQSKFVGQASELIAGRAWFAFVYQKILVCMVVRRRVHGAWTPGF